jgi:hypothetical protein
MNRQFSEEVQFVNKYMMFNILTIKKMQIKMTLRFYLTLLRMAIIKIQTTNAVENGRVEG